MHHRRPLATTSKCGLEERGPARLRGQRGPRSRGPPPCESRLEGRERGASREPAGGSSGRAERVSQPGTAGAIPMAASRRQRGVRRPSLERAAGVGQVWGALGCPHLASEPPGCVCKAASYPQVVGGFLPQGPEFSQGEVVVVLVCAPPIAPCPPVASKDTPLLTGVGLGVGLMWGCSGHPHFAACPPAASSKQSRIHGRGGFLLQAPESS